MKKAGKKNSQPIRILQVGMHDQIGGIETFLMNYYRNINHDKVQFNFISIHNKMCFENEIKKIGGKVYHLPSPKKRPLKHYIMLRKILSSNHYDAIHVHMRSAANILPVLAGKHSKTRTIVHSHSSNTPFGITRKILHAINKPTVGKSDYLFACSEKSGEWLFDDRPFTVIQNAVDINKYKFSSQKRRNFRKKFKINQDQLVIGHIGRFEEEKNHQYILKVFKKISTTNPEAILLLAGAGSLQSTIKQKVAELGLNDNVIFAGTLSDPSDFYNAIDVFIMPSLFEGFPMAGVEAQVAGAQCIFSNTISEEIAICNKTKLLPISDNDIDKWAKTIEQASAKTPSRSTPKQKDLKKYSIKEFAKGLESFYATLNNAPKKINVINRLFCIGYVLTLSAEILYSLSYLRPLLPIINVIGMFCLLSYNLYNLWKSKSLKHAIIFCSLLSLSMITYLFSKDTIPLKLYLLFYATYNFSFKKCIELDFKARLILFIAIIVLSLFGLSQTRTFQRIDGTIRYTFGFAHPNAFGIYSSMLVLEKLFLDYHKTSKKTYKNNIIFSCIILMINLFFTNSRTICIILAIITLIYAIPKRLLNNICRHPLTHILTKYCFVYFTIISIMLIAVAYINSSIAGAINRALSYRPNYYGVFFQKIGFNLLGAPMPDMIAGMPLDNAYLTILFKYGFVQYIILAGLSILTYKKLFKNNESFLIFILSFMLAYGTMETAAIKPGVDVFILAFSYSINKERNR